MTADLPGTPATSDELVRVFRESYRAAEQQGFEPCTVDEAVRVGLDAVRPLIEAAERQRISQRIRAIPHSRAVNDTEWDHLQVDAVDDAVWDR